MKFHLLRRRKKIISKIKWIGAVIFGLLIKRDISGYLNCGCINDAVQLAATF